MASIQHVSAERSPRLVLDAPGGNVTLDLFVLTEAVGSLLGEALRPCGLSATHYAVYGQLVARAQTPGELSQTLNLPRSTLSGHLNAMKRRGDIRRDQAARDGRSWMISLTDQGRERFAAGKPAVARVIRAVHEAMGDEEEVLAVRLTLGRLDAAIRSARETTDTDAG